MAQGLFAGSRWAFAQIQNMQKYPFAKRESLCRATAQAGAYSEVKQNRFYQVQCAEKWQKIMDLKKITIVFIAALAAVTAISACGQKDAAAPTAENTPVVAAPVEQEEQEEKPVQEPDPKAALEEIYKTLGREEEVIEATAQEVEDVVGLDMGTVDEFYIRYLPTDFGAADVYIIKPEDGEESAVIEALKKRQEQRIREFTDYDIYNSTEISENAIIFKQGGYVVMLMLEDNEMGRSIVEEYIPNNLEISR